MNLIEAMHVDMVQAVHFHYHGTYYIASGWWMIEAYEDSGNKDKVIPESYHDFDTKEELMNAPLFDGKTMKDIFEDVEDVIVET